MGLRKVEGYQMHKNKLLGLFVIVFVMLAVSSCGGGGENDAPPEPGTGCENGIGGNYTITYNDCPTCSAYPGVYAAVQTYEFMITQSGTSLQFKTANGSRTIFTGSIDDSCVISTADGWNSIQYYCNGNWTNGEMELVCDLIANCSQTDNYINGTCRQISTRD